MGHGLESTDDYRFPKLGEAEEQKTKREGKKQLRQDEKEWNTRCSAFTTDNGGLLIPKPAGGDLALPADSASFEWGIKDENQMDRNDEHSVRPGDERA